MPKSLPITPNEVRQSGFLSFQPIPLNQYRRDIATEARRYPPNQLAQAYEDMALIRGFETLLQEVKLKGEYGGIAYEHRGPAHLSIGQEAVAVGMALSLKPEDAIFGSHRSHGETLAKGLAAIHQLDEATLMSIMANALDGAILKVIEHDTPSPGRSDEPVQSIREMAIDFLLYGTLAEIFGRETGFNRGMGGSMHVFFTPFGIYPNNAIVGGSADIATGAALFRRVHEQGGIVVANIGDASAACGPVWEAMQFAAMDQFHSLWSKREGNAGGLPILFNFINNFYGMGGQPFGETGGMGVLARMGAGVNPQQMHAERVDGYSPLAVADAIARKRMLLEAGDGPALLDTITYRFSGHSPSDASSYRDKAEIEAWMKQDSLATFRDSLQQSGLAEPTQFDGLSSKIEAQLLRAFRRAVSPDLSPRANLMVTDCLLDRATFAPNLASPEFISQMKIVEFGQDNPRIKQIAGKSRSGIGEEGELLPKGKCVNYRDALFEAIRDQFAIDPLLIAYGEENRDWGGAFGVYRGLTEALPYSRLFNAPIAEGAIIGTAVGYAMAGGRALVELMYCDFLGRAGDELFNQLAKWRAMSGGEMKLPVVVRVSVGSKYGAQHSQDWSSLCAHIPGMQVLYPATPYDAKGLLAAALAGDNPVIFFESQRLYDAPEFFYGETGVPEEPYLTPIGLPDIKVEGEDITLLSLGATLPRAIEVASVLSEEYSISCEVIDARSLVPFDLEPLLASVKKTGLLLLTSDACERGSFLHTLASKVTRLAFDDLDAPPVVVGARNWITPPDELEEAFFPTVADLLDAIHGQLLPLPGYKAARNVGRDEELRRSRLGI